MITSARRLTSLTKPLPPRAVTPGFHPDHHRKPGHRSIENSCRSRAWQRDGFAGSSASSLTHLDTVGGDSPTHGSGTRTNVSSKSPYTYLSADENLDNAIPHTTFTSTSRAETAVLASGLSRLR
jgi:hypothetical protein